MKNSTNQPYKPFYLTPGFAAIMVLFVAIVIVTVDHSNKDVASGQTKTTSTYDSVSGTPYPSGNSSTPTPIPVIDDTDDPGIVDDSDTPVTPSTDTDTTTPTTDTTPATNPPSTGTSSVSDGNNTGTTNGTTATTTPVDETVPFTENVENGVLTITSNNVSPTTVMGVQTGGIPVVNDPISYTVATVAVGLLAALAGSIANAMASSSSIAQAIINLWNSFLTWLGFNRRKREHRWGVVIEHETGLPLANTLISLERIVKDNNGRVSKIEHIANTKTDDAGAYGFIVEPGLYQLNIKKPGFHIVGDELNTSSVEVTITSEYYSLVVPDIRMSAGPLTVEKRVHSIRLWNVIGATLQILTPLFLIAGTVLTILTYEPSTRFTIISILYVVFWIYWIWNAILAQRRSPWGLVADTNTSGAIPLAIIRVMDENQNRLIRTAVTNRTGQYGLLLNQANYSVTAYKPGYQPSSPINVEVKDRLSVINQKINLTPYS